jgi:c(7)-type cytochrome triheme protein
MRVRATVVVALLAAGPVLAAAYPAVLRIPRSPAATVGVDFPRALFSHRTHGSSGCYACHPSAFPQAPLTFTHQEMRRGQFCARCHDGRTAVAVATLACGACHVAP